MVDFGRLGESMAQRRLVTDKLSLVAAMVYNEHMPDKPSMVTFEVDSADVLRDDVTQSHLEQSLGFEEASKWDMGGKFRLCGVKRLGEGTVPSDAQLILIPKSDTDYTHMMAYWRDSSDVNGGPLSFGIVGMHLGEDTVYSFGKAFELDCTNLETMLHGLEVNADEMKNPSFYVVHTHDKDYMIEDDYKQAALAYVAKETPITNHVESEFIPFDDDYDNKSFLNLYYAVTGELIGTDKDLYYDYEFGVHDVKLPEGVHAVGHFKSGVPNDTDKTLKDAKDFFILSSDEGTLVVQAGQPSGTYETGLSAMYGPGACWKYGGEFLDVESLLVSAINNDNPNWDYTIDVNGDVCTYEKNLTDPILKTSHGVNKRVNDMGMSL